MFQPPRIDDFVSSCGKLQRTFAVLCSAHLVLTWGAPSRCAGGQPRAWRRRPTARRPGDALVLVNAHRAVVKIESIYMLRFLRNIFTNTTRHKRFLCMRRRGVGVMGGWNALACCAPVPRTNGRRLPTPRTGPDT